MKTKILILSFLIGVILSSYGQSQNFDAPKETNTIILLKEGSQTNFGIVFNKFKLSWFNVMGMRGGSGSQTLSLTFTNNSSKTIKYVFIKYWGINSVNDIESDNFQRKEFSVKCTGPFEVGRLYKQFVQIALFCPNKLTAYPYELNLTYMDGTEQEIEIDGANLKSIFPCIDFIKINNKNN